MKKILLLGLTAAGLIALSLGGYETVKTLSTIRFFDLVTIIKKRNGWNIPDGLVLATIDTESSFDPEAVKTEYPIGGSEQVYKDASVGLMQVLYSTAKWLGFAGDIWDLQDPETGLTYGMKYQVYLFNRYGDWDKVIHAYNQGPGNFDKGKRVPVYYGKVKTRWIKYDAMLAAGGEITP